MSTSTHQIAVEGVDKTGPAFQSIQARAISASQRISRVVGGAIAAAGAYLGVRAIKGGIDELGNLSDMAMKAGTSVEALTQSSLAFQVAGLNMPVESLAKSFQYLKKQTGEGGMDHFYKTLESISKIDDAAERGAALVKNFGRSGLELQPLVDGGEEAARKMRELAEIMPNISTAAANAGDEAADTLKILGTGIRNLFLKVIGSIVGWFSDDFPGGVRAGALSAINYLEAFAKKTKAIFVAAGEYIAAGMNYAFDYFEFGADFANAQFSKYTSAANDEFTNKWMAIDAQREAYVNKLKEMSVDDLAGALAGPKGKSVGDAIGTAAAKAATRVSNQLIAGGSNAAQRLSILGPSYQNEQKKQTTLLEAIKNNTAKAAENSEADALPETDLGVS